ncbi:hypothetical protein K501DRAFT_289299 [Backusella circina FSU 941]|nr:hypothetical protein K501DRAFT_289299 [Backusella circina FSU 941]
MFDSSLGRYWNTITRRMKKLPYRRHSSCSVSSDSSEKSVRFQNEDTIYYTHSASEYDRSATLESRKHKASLGKLYLSEPDQLELDSPFQDELVLANTDINARRRYYSMTILIKIRSQ